jgi:hypothetical protein
MMALTISENKDRCGDETESTGGIMRAPYGVFPVESGGPVIGLGLFFLLVAGMSLILGTDAGIWPVTLLFGGFGFFLIWLGLTK